MYVLGIVEGHNCSAALLKEGECVAFCFEERLTRLKNEFGFPRRSIEYCLDSQNIKPSDVDYVALVTINLPFQQVVTKREAKFTVKDYIKEQECYWKPKLINGEDPDYLSLFSDKIDLENFSYKVLSEDLSKIGNGEFRNIRINRVKQYFGIKEENIKIVHHHLAHSYYAIYSNPNCFKNDLLVLVADGYGDDCSSSVGIFSKGKFEFIAKSKENGIGRIYRYVTLLLGMRPGVDEYKVMGLAPYAKEHDWKPVYKVLASYLKVDGLEIKYTNPDKDIYFSLKERLRFFRFDGIAAGVQRFCEDISAEWLENCISETGISRIVYSGGVSMNIKINMELSKLNKLDDLFVGASGGDESISLGAAYVVHDEKHQTPIIPLKQVYLGPSYGRNEVVQALDKMPEEFIITENPDDELIAEKLANGLVIARSVGNMEFGARALGNRSILADARDPSMIKKINEKVKKRDFWMPFAPVILEEREKDYIINPKKLRSPYMTIGFHSTELAQKHLKAALHPADNTVRAQILSEESNPKLYSLIKKYSEITGVGGLLNTSFNLHGEPICCSPIDSIKTFLSTELDALLLDGFLIVRKNV